MYYRQPQEPSLTEYNAGLEEISQKLREEQERSARLVYFLRSGNRAAAQLSLADTLLSDRLFGVV